MVSLSVAQASAFTIAGVKRAWGWLKRLYDGEGGGRPGDVPAPNTGMDGTADAAVTAANNLIREAAEGGVRAVNAAVDGAIVRLQASVTASIDASNELNASCRRANEAWAKAEQEMTTLRQERMNFELELKQTAQSLVDALQQAPEPSSSCKVS
ncbi:hypothetical protein KCU85_g2625, partial [Aureobasidium melanogenum]